MVWRIKCEFQLTKRTLYSLMCFFFIRFTVIIQWKKLFLWFFSLYSSNYYHYNSVWRFDCCVYLWTDVCSFCVGHSTQIGRKKYQSNWNFDGKLKYYWLQMKYRAPRKSNAETIRHAENIVILHKQKHWPVMCRLLTSNPSLNWMFKKRINSNYYCNTLNLKTMLVWLCALIVYINSMHAYMCIYVYGKSEKKKHFHRSI